jgi:hypothetical protein
MRGDSGKRSPSIAELSSGQWGRFFFGQVKAHGPDMGLGSAVAKADAGNHE